MNGIRFAIICCYILTTNRSLRDKIERTQAKPQKNTKTNDNGNSNLACFVRTLLLMWPNIVVMERKRKRERAHNSLHALLTLNYQTLSIGHMKRPDKNPNMFELRAIRV